MTRRIKFVIACVAIGALSWSTTALAFADSERALFGPIGVAQGELVRVSVYAVGNPNDMPWDFVVRFFNVHGSLVRQRRLQLAPGQIGFTDIRVGNPDEFPADVLGRRTVRAEIVVFNPQPDPPGRYFATLEVINAGTGRTRVFIGNPDEVPNPTR